MKWGRLYDNIEQHYIVVNWAKRLFQSSIDPLLQSRATLQDIKPVPRPKLLCTYDDFSQVSAILD